MKATELERRLELAKKALKRIAEPDFKNYHKMVDESISIAKEAL